MTTPIHLLIIVVSIALTMVVSFTYLPRLEHCMWRRRRKRAIRRQNRLIARYVEIGLRWGHDEGYRVFFLKPDEHWRHRRQLDKLAAQYKALGFVPLTDDDWIDAGAIGEPFAHKLRIRKSTSK